VVASHFGPCKPDHNAHRRITVEEFLLCRRISPLSKNFSSKFKRCSRNCLARPNAVAPDWRLGLARPRQGSTLSSTPIRTPKKPWLQLAQLYLRLAVAPKARLEKARTRTPQLVTGCPDHQWARANLRRDNRRAHRRDPPARIAVRPPPRRDPSPFPLAHMTGRCAAGWCEPAGLVLAAPIFAPTGRACAAVSAFRTSPR
jgi:hypothetical protein